jgi:hypothetical protein
MAKTKWIAPWVLAAGFLFAGDLYSGPVLDQAYTDVMCSKCTSGLGETLDGFYPFSGETVTAGITGNLTSVSIFAGAVDPALTIPWIIDIVAAPGGIPNGDVLAVSNPFALPFDYAWTSIPIPSSPFMVAGTSFAIVIQLQGVPPNSFTSGAGIWAGGIDTTDPYPGGQLVAGPALNSLSGFDFGSFGQGDLFFQTFVTPAAIPEPGTFVLLLLALGLMAVRSRRPPLMLLR